MSKTLIILNPHAGSGKAGKAWQKLEALLWDLLGELVIAVTQHPGEVAQHLDKAYNAGLRRVIAIGGEGTNYVLVNALIALNEQNPGSEPMIFGHLPGGTGRDMARTLGMPLKIEAAAQWIAHAQPRPVDVGQLDYGAGSLYFLNVASAGLSGAIAAEVNKTVSRRPWTYFQAAAKGIIKYARQPLQIVLDGDEWYEGKAYVVAIANGRTFAGGMQVAPEAEIDDGLFDVILAKDASKLSILQVLLRVYNGSHLSHPAVEFSKAKDVRISSPEGSLGFETDGEPGAGGELHFSLRPGLLQMLG